DDAIRRRTRALTEIILEIWQVPEGHRSGFSRAAPRLRHTLHLADLIGGRVLESGCSLHPRRKKFQDKVATLLGDGRIEIDGATFGSLSDAARSITGRPTNGWYFFLVDPVAKRSLRDVRSDYLQAM